MQFVWLYFPREKIQGVTSDIPQPNSQYQGSALMATTTVGYFLLLISGLYQGKLLTQMMLVTTNVPFKSLETLTQRIASGQMKLVVNSVNNAQFEKINASFGEEGRLYW